MTAPTAAGVPLSRSPMAPGMAGIDQTIRAMSDAAMGIYGAGSVKIRDLAMRIVSEYGAPEKDLFAEMVAIHEWIKTNIRYLKDPVGYEFLTFPESLAYDTKQGDCDDMATLEAAMLAAIGIPSRFVVIGAGKDAKPEHVYLQAFIRSGSGVRIIPLDPIMKNKPAGWEAPNPTFIKRYPLTTLPGSATGGIFGFALVALFGYGAFRWWQHRQKINKLHRKIANAG